MSRFSASVATIGSALLLFAVAVPAQAQATPENQPQLQSQPQTQSQAALSRVRIVRLSEIRGAVQLDRSVGHGYEPALVNMPVVEENRLETAMGVAEVEFEDNSTLRLGPNSEIQFLLLGRTPQGNTVSTVRLVRGTAYISLVKSRRKTANVFDLAFGDRNIHLRPDTHVRLEIDDQLAKLAVLGGAVYVDNPNGAIEISRKSTATFALAVNTPPEVAKGVKSEWPLDTWDKRLDQYHARVASLSSFGGVPYSYGASDMLYYGAFQNEGGCGNMWRPYFASAAWNPYASGAWAYYSGAGYSWVSPYPWGWTPYHYGSWSFCPGAGWGWMPGGSWMGLNNVASAASNGTTVIRRPPVVPHPPRVGGPSILSVNQSVLVRSGLDREGSFVFRKDSAGLGIPRNILGNLRSYSEPAIRKGVATMPTYLSTGPSNGMRGAGYAARRGYAPSSGGTSSARSTISAGSTGGVSMSMPSAPSMSSAPAPASAGGARGGGRH